MNRLYLLFLLMACISCREEAPVKEQLPVEKPAPSMDTAAGQPEVLIDDTLDAIAAVIAGERPVSASYPAVVKDSAYAAYSKKFTSQWEKFDSTRLRQLRPFADSIIAGKVKADFVFYPFSGPDLLYPGVFFPNARSYLLVGLEPPGDLPDFSRTDSVGSYFNMLSRSLTAIMRFSFFRTESMREDLQSDELNGTIHLLLLFVKKLNGSVVSAERIYIDSTGTVAVIAKDERRHGGAPGWRVVYRDAAGVSRTLEYCRENLADANMKFHPAIAHYVEKQPAPVTYLKGASYLLHKPYFSVTRDLILSSSAAVVEDDSGIPLRYFLKDASAWELSFYGSYTKPIPKFARHFQPALDSVYSTGHARPLNFGLGYNYRDRNSNLMIAVRRKSGS